MSVQSLTQLMPTYARDIAVNLTNLADETLLTEQQKWGTFLSCAHAVGVPEVIQHMEAASVTALSDEAADAARSAAAIMAMNNVYYRFVHLSSNPEYATLPAKLRMNFIGSPGIEKDDFELFSLAVSAMNGCGMCIDSHERLLQQHGVKAETIQAAVRIGAIMKAVATVHATL